MVANLYDYEHIQVTLASEIEDGQDYYIDLIEEEISMTCWRLYTQFMPKVEAEDSLIETSVVLD